MRRGSLRSSPAGGTASALTALKVSRGDRGVFAPFCVVPSVRHPPPNLPPPFSRASAVPPERREWHGADQVKCKSAPLESTWSAQAIAKMCLLLLRYHNADGLCSQRRQGANLHGSGAGRPAVCL